MNKHLRTTSALILCGLAAVLGGSAEATPLSSAALSGHRLQSGAASWYQSGRRTANGEAFNPNGMTAAHRTLPFGTRVRVVHQGTGRSVVVRINDRGPFVGGRIIDLARGSARALGMTGTAKVALYRL